MRKGTYLGAAKTVGVCVLVAACLGGCATASVDRSRAQATSTPPVQAQVEQVSIPYDPTLPIFVVAVAPMSYSASGQMSGGAQEASVQTTNVGPGISAQFTTALTRVGNISVLSYEALQKDAQGRYSCVLEDGEVGPFLITGVVTEFAETADLSGRSRGARLGGVGAVTGLVGAATGNRAVRNVGAGVAIANPQMSQEELERTGVVGLDLQLVDGRTGRITSGYNVHGTFTTVSSRSGASLFGIGGSSVEFAASALGQATRAAMNDAVKQTVDGLRIAARR